MLVTLNEAFKCLKMTKGTTLTCTKRLLTALHTGPLHTNPRGDNWQAAGHDGARPGMLSRNGHGMQEMSAAGCW